MDLRYVLQLLGILTCAISTHSTASKDRIVQTLGERHRRYALSEFLVPPPVPQIPQRALPQGRTGRNASPRPTESLGYFSKFINWLNPFGSGTTANVPPLAPPPLESLNLPKFYRPETPLGSPTGPPTVSPTGPPLVTLQNVYDAAHPAIFGRPPLAQPPAGINVYEDRHRHRGQNENCNLCNKVPWLPMGHGTSAGAYLPPIGKERPTGISSGEYLPSRDRDAHRGSVDGLSQEVKIQDFFYAPPSMLGQNGDVPPIGPLPNPHLYPGPMPPLYKAELFDYPSRSNYPVFEDGNAGHAAVASGLPMAEGVRSTVLTPGRETEFDRSVPPFSRPSDSTKIENIGIPKEEEKVAFESHRASGPSHGSGSIDQGYDRLNSYLNSGLQAADSFSSASQEHERGSPTIDSSSLIEETRTSIGQDYDSSSPGIRTRLTGTGGSDNVGDTSLGIDQRYVDTSLLTFQRTDQSVSPSAVGYDRYGYGSVGSEEQPYKDDGGGRISTSSVGTIGDSHASGTGGFSNIENSRIHYEESPLTDLTKTSESRTGSSSTSSSSSASTSSIFVDFDGTSDIKTSLDYDPRRNPLQVEREAVRPNSPSVHGNEEHFLNYTAESSLQDDKEKKFFAIDINNDAKWRDGSQSPDDSLFAEPPVRTVDSWSVVLSTTMRTSQEEASLGNRSSTNDSTEDNSNLRQYGAKRNKQVQVIIPYTSQYTPLPFRSSSYDIRKDNVERTQPRKVSFLGNLSSRDAYVTEESRSAIKVASTPESSTESENFNALGELRSTEGDLFTTIKRVLPNVGTVKNVNNSIDVHRLQKNIDNWTIQEYSQGTTFSTVIPSSSHPYLQPSKKIPNEYLTTSTESGERTDRLHDHEDNVKSFALAGFSFNDIEDEESNRLEESRIETVHIESPRNNEELKTTDVNDSKTMNASWLMGQVSSWKGFPVSISSVDKERVYVVTPQTTVTSPPPPPPPTTTTTTTTTTTKATPSRRGEENKFNTETNLRKGNVVYTKNLKTKQDEFEKIERAYQVLPQAVNNLAVASTGPETLPLWGIMEHEEFASLSRSSEDERRDEEPAVAPVLYDGHSKVSRARR